MVWKYAGRYVLPFSPSNMKMDIRWNTALADTISSVRTRSLSKEYPQFTVKYSTLLKGAGLQFATDRVLRDLDQEVLVPMWQDVATERISSTEVALSSTDKTFYKVGSQVLLWASDTEWQIVDVTVVNDTSVEFGVNSTDWKCVAPIEEGFMAASPSTSTDRNRNTKLDYSVVIKRLDGPLSTTGGGVSSGVIIGGREYGTAVIGDLEWMTENLSYDSGDYMYPDGDINNVSDYGLLYRYQTALNLVPEGWRLPTKDDFKGLISETAEPEYQSELDPDNFPNASKYLKDDILYWNTSANIVNNDLLFSARGAGAVWGQDKNNTSYISDPLKTLARFHTTTVAPTGSGWRWICNINDGTGINFTSEWVEIENINRRNFSVRYVRDTEGWLGDPPVPYPEDPKLTRTPIQSTKANNYSLHINTVKSVGGIVKVNSMRSVPTVTTTHTWDNQNRSEYLDMLDFAARCRGRKNAFDTASFKCDLIPLNEGTIGDGYLDVLDPGLQSLNLVGTRFTVIRGHSWDSAEVYEVLSLQNVTGGVRLILDKAIAVTIFTTDAVSNIRQSRLASDVLSVEIDSFNRSSSSIAVRDINEGG